MKTWMRRMVCGMGLLLGVCATAQAFPTKLVSIVIGFPVGGPLDQPHACCRTACKPSWAGR